MAFRTRGGQIRRAVASARARIRSCRGFTLIEVLVATLLLSIGILALVGVVSLATSEAGDTNQRKKAIVLAERRIEALSGLAYEDSLLVAGQTFSDQDNPIDGVFNVTWQTVDDDPVPNCKKVTAQVSWDVGGKQKSVQLVTVLSQAKR